jgi:hypothetical protein
MRKEMKIWGLKSSLEVGRLQKSTNLGPKNSLEVGRLEKSTNLGPKNSLEVDRLDRIKIWGPNTHLRWVTGMVARRFSGPTYLVCITLSSDENHTMENCLRRLDCP